MELKMKTWRRLRIVTRNSRMIAGMSRTAAGLTLGPVRKKPQLTAHPTAAALARMSLVEDQNDRCRGRSNTLQVLNSLQFSYVKIKTGYAKEVSGNVLIAK
jgi:hypothetical protein